MSILGLVGAESFAAQRFTNIRQKVFYQYPNGAFPLAGLLSVAKEKETNDPQFSHYEKRMKKQWTYTASQGSSKGPIMTSAGADPGDPVTWTTDTEYQLKVDSTGNFRPGHLIQVYTAVGGSVTNATWIKGVVTAIVSTTVLKVRATNTVANVQNGTTDENVDKEVLIVGNAFAEGDVSNTREVYNLPVETFNYTQIFRSKFTFTGTALSTSAKFDQTGPYKDKSKEASLDHMLELEKNLLFGKRHMYADPTTGLVTRTFGGILWYLEQYEANAYEDTPTATADADDDKRIITNSAGTINDTTYHTYLERLFRVTNNAANEKLCLCGSGFLLTLQNMYRGQTVLQAHMNKTDTFGLAVVSHVTPFGTVHYKTHPLFNQNPTLRYNGLFLDANDLWLRPLIGRNTKLLKNRQPNDADYRMDEWLGELGFEMHHPEANMYFQNMRTYVAS
jgi:hypothetical protein